jgi:hypothetical protein
MSVLTEHVSSGPLVVSAGQCVVDLGASPRPHQIIDSCDPFQTTPQKTTDRLGCRVRQCSPISFLCQHCSNHIANLSPQETLALAFHQHNTKRPEVRALVDRTALFGLVCRSPRIIRRSAKDHCRRVDRSDATLSSLNTFASPSREL